MKIFLKPTKHSSYSWYFSQNSATRGNDYGDRMTTRDNIIYYTLTAVVFVGIVVCSLLFHTPRQPTNGGSERENISTIVIAASAVVTAVATVVLVKTTRRYVRLTQEYVSVTNEILKATNKDPAVPHGLTRIRCAVMLMRLQTRRLPNAPVILAYPRSVFGMVCNASIAPDYNPIEHDFANIKRKREYHPEKSIEDIIQRGRRFF